MKLNTLYKWQLELQTGELFDQYGRNGTEASSKSVDPNNVVRISYIPALSILAQHNIIIDKKSGELFVRRFQRGFIKQQSDGFKLKEYLHCCVTNRYRVYVFSNGNTLITNKDYELYL